LEDAKYNFKTLPAVRMKSPAGNDCRNGANATGYRLLAAAIRWRRLASRCLRLRNSLGFS
jgi:hypothetical protein